MPDASEERRKRVRSTVRLAAQYVARREAGENVSWVTEARIARLDADGRPTKAAVAKIGPMIFSTAPSAAGDTPSMAGCPSGPPTAVRRGSINIECNINEWSATTPTLHGPIGPNGEIISEPGQWLHDGKPLLPHTHTDPRLCSGCAWEPGS